MRITLPCLLLLLSLSACQPDNPAPSLIIHNANIWTGDINKPDAQAMAIHADTIMAIGTNEEISGINASEVEAISVPPPFTLLTVPETPFVVAIFGYPATFSPNLFLK